MTQQEFENLTQRTTSAEDYRIIENLYMAAGDMDKREFCKELKAMCAYDYADDKIILRRCLCEIGKRVAHLEDDNNKLSKANKCRTGYLAEMLVGKAHKYGDIEMHREACCLIGHAAVVKMTIDMGLPLFDDDKKYICQLLDEQYCNGKISNQ